MAHRCFSGLLLSVVIILVALGSAECDQGNLGTESQKDVFLQSDVKILLGRKMLQHSRESNSKKTDETKALTEAADEVANLMHRDYGKMARRKPPINNHVPKD
ncbi:uncharacterized protein LOC125203130 [Salvia hispanica]|uniref:uncharacterized protein LOC125203130 n=1 Tax=Salvia hispanica TaxID=49212 RepID=UPI0020095AC2|nr:uncharacterized protein LOC125203130 [Salvia hispanica]